MEVKVEKKGEPGGDRAILDKLSRMVYADDLEKFVRDTADSMMAGWEVEARVGPQKVGDWKFEGEGNAGENWEGSEDAPYTMPLAGNRRPVPTPDSHRSLTSHMSSGAHRRTHHTKVQRCSGDPS